MCYADSAAQARKNMSDGPEVCDIRTIFGQGWATSTLHEKSQVASRATFDPHSAPPCSAELVLVKLALQLIHFIYAKISCMLFLSVAQTFLYFRHFEFGYLYKVPSLFSHSYKYLTMAGAFQNRW